MKIIYKNKHAQILKEIEISSKDFYLESTSIKGKFKTKETYKNEKLIKFSIFDVDGKSHSEILHNERLKGIEISIGNRIHIGAFRHEKLYHYDTDGVLETIFNEVFDPENNVIMSSYSEDLENEKPYWNGTSKYYYDKSIRPDNALFECHYNDDGKLIPITIDIEELGLGEHDGTWIYDNEEGVKELMEIFKMSRSLAEFYVSSDLLPK